MLSLSVIHDGQRAPPGGPCQRSSCADNLPTIHNQMQPQDCHIEAPTGLITPSLQQLPALVGAIPCLDNEASLIPPPEDREMLWKKR